MFIKSSKIHHMDFKIGYLRENLEIENIENKELNNSNYFQVRYK